LEVPATTSSSPALKRPVEGLDAPSGAPPSFTDVSGMMLFLGSSQVGRLRHFVRHTPHVTSAGVRSPSTRFARSGHLDSAGCRCLHRAERREAPRSRGGGSAWESNPPTSL